MHEIAVLLGYLTELGVDGFMMSPAYGYAAVQADEPERAPQEIFMTRDDIHAKFREAETAPCLVSAQHVADLSGVLARRARADAAPPGPTRRATCAAGKDRAT